MKVSKENDFGDLEDVPDGTTNGVTDEEADAAEEDSSQEAKTKEISEQRSQLITVITFERLHLKHSFSFSISNILIDILYYFANYYILFLLLLLATTSFCSF